MQQAAQGRQRQTQDRADSQFEQRADRAQQQIAEPARQLEALSQQAQQPQQQAHLGFVAADDNATLRQAQEAQRAGEPLILVKQVTRRKAVELSVALDSLRDRQDQTTQTALEALNLETSRIPALRGGAGFNWFGVGDRVTSFDTANTGQTDGAITLQREDGLATADSMNRALREADGARRGTEVTNEPKLNDAEVAIKQFAEGANVIPVDGAGQVPGADQDEGKRAEGMLSLRNNSTSGTTDGEQDLVDLVIVFRSDALTPAATVPEPAQQTEVTPPSTQPGDAVGNQAPATDPR
jgi:hypothetical protein